MWRNDSTFHLLRRVMQRHNALWRERLPDLTPVQYSVLLSIDRLPGADQRSIGEASAVEPTTTANLIGRLQASGLVTREPDPEDRRRQRLSLTTTGARTLRDATPLVRSVRDELLAPLDPEVTAELRAILLTLEGGHPRGPGPKEMP
ncbi:MarR family transcriptional regulator [Cellulomonas sp. NPDC089187]|uniref:MarR family winged helix-turn-helix transcriptional regulator n=1 Tax=Cellulomonas sp. NPDC089187 TaxID=3154970 RepID=UPI00344061D3